MTDASLSIAMDHLEMKMDEVRSACEAAPLGGKKNVSLRRYQSAERAKTSGDEKECSRRLDAALKALM